MSSERLSAGRTNRPAKFPAAVVTSRGWVRLKAAQAVATPRAVIADPWAPAAAPAANSPTASRMEPNSLMEAIQPLV
jgi:hypothetical protein